MKKESSFHSFEIEFAQAAKCLAHPARLQIITLLSKHKDRTCKEIVAELPLSQSTVSKHLKDLLDDNFICRKTSGTQSIYTLEWNKMGRVFELFERYQARTMMNRPKRNCC